MPATKRFKRLKVACFEGHWETDMRTRQSVLPVLEFLEHAGFISYFHRPVATAEQFKRDFGAWAQQARYRDYEVAFVATHGDTESLHFGSDALELNELSKELKSALRGRIVYFGSCATASDSPESRSGRFKKVVKRFRSVTGAKAVCGYVYDVDFAEAAAFEILLFSWLAEYRTRLPGLRKVANNYRDLVRVLGFVVDAPASRSR